MRMSLKEWNEIQYEVINEVDIVDIIDIYKLASLFSYYRDCNYENKESIKESLKDLAIGYLNYSVLYK